jgi:hypothetical protein
MELASQPRLSASPCKSQTPQPCEDSPASRLAFFLSAAPTKSSKFRSRLARVMTAAAVGFALLCRLCASPRDRPAAIPDCCCGRA